MIGEIRKHYFLFINSVICPEPLIQFLFQLHSRVCDDIMHPKGLRTEFFFFLQHSSCKSCPLRTDAQTRYQALYLFFFFSFFFKSDLTGYRYRPVLACVPPACGSMSMDIEFIYICLGYLPGTTPTAESTSLYLKIRKKFLRRSNCGSPLQFGASYLLVIFFDCEFSKN